MGRLLLSYILFELNAFVLQHGRVASKICLVVNDRNNLFFIKQIKTIEQPRPNAHDSQWKATASTCLDLFGSLLKTVAAGGVS